MNIPLWAALVCAPAVLAPAASWAQAVSSTTAAQTPAAPKPKEKKTLANDKAIKALAAKYGVSPGEIAALRKQGMSWSDIGHALVISKLAGQPLATIVSEFQSSKSWEALVQKYGLDANQVEKEAADAAKTGRDAEARVSGKSSSSRASSGDRGAHGGHGGSDPRRR